MSTAAAYTPPGFVPSPAPIPLAVAPAAPAKGLTFPQILILMVTGFALVVGGLFVNHAFFASSGGSTARVDTAKIAKVYTPELAAAFGDGCLAAGDKIAMGKTMVEAQTAMQEAFLKSRETAFTLRVNPELTKLIGEGSEPTTADQRAAVADFWTTLGHHLKGSK